MASAALSALLTCLLPRPLSYVVFYVFADSVRKVLLLTQPAKPMKITGHPFSHILHNNQRGQSMAVAKDLLVINDPSSVCHHASVLLASCFCRNACCFLIVQWLLHLLASHPCSRKEHGRNKQLSLPFYFEVKYLLEMPPSTHSAICISEKVSFGYP